MKRSQKTFFYLILFILPLALWMGLETLANWATHRFDPLKRDRKKDTYYLNQSYFNDFFLFEKKDLFPTSASNRAIHAQKGGRFRIFVVGESTPAGYPYNTFPQFECPTSFPNYLRAVLQYNRSLPEIELLNASCNALNSLNVLDVFSSLIKYQPDLVIVYSGHNEFFGPNEFVIPKEKTALYQNRTLYALFMGLRRTFLYQGMLKGIRWISPRTTGRTMDDLQWSRNNTVAFHDHLNQVVADNYRRNLTDLIRLARKHHIQVMLCTPVSNWTFPPFISKNQFIGDQRAIVNWDSLDTQAKTAFNSGDMAKALEIWQRLYQLDSTNASVSYHAGMAFVRQKDYESAGLALLQAKDYDLLPFRARTFFPVICRDLASRHSVLLADVESYFVQQSQRTYPEPSLFIDHVHPNDLGNYYIALLLAKTLVDGGVFAGVTALDYPGYEQCQKALRIDPINVRQVEVDFAEQSYIKMLSELNPEIKGFLGRLRARAIDEAKKP
ncbi:hypothetical protein GX408_08790 [bacterium]|nr:hypothetical protein [bacterium]